MTDQELDSLKDIPARTLTCSCRQLLSQMLNPEQPLLTSGHLARDFRGLAELMGFSYNEIRNFQRASDPTGKILDSWELKGTTLGDLVQMFEMMERYDVIDEALPLLNKIAENYREREKDKPLQVDEVSSCRQPSCASSNPDVMTVEDIQNKNDLSRYDAYVCYADEDLDFVWNLSMRLESAGLKLYIRERDLLAGVIEHDAVVRLIKERCNFVLIILSPEFVNSPQCEFQAKFVSGIAIEQRQRILIPVIYKTCVIPDVIRYLTKLDFTRFEIRELSWNRLIASLSSGNQNFVPHSTSIPFNLAPALPSPPTTSLISHSPEPEPKPARRKILRRLKLSSSSSASSGFVSQGSNYERIPQ